MPLHTWQTACASRAGASATRPRFPVRAAAYVALAAASGMLFLIVKPGVHGPGLVHGHRELAFAVDAGSAWLCPRPCASADGGRPGLRWRRTPVMTTPIATAVRGGA